MNVPADRESTGLEFPNDRGLALVVQGEAIVNSVLRGQLTDLGFEVLSCDSGHEAIELLDNNKLSLLFLTPQLTDISSPELVNYIRSDLAYDALPIIILASAADIGLQDCLDSGGDDYLAAEYTPAELNARIAAVERLRGLQHLYNDSIHEQVVAKQILSLALASRREKVEGMQVMSRSAAIFSGDLVLSALNPDGRLNILLADFTGHGLSAAIGVLPVADMFSVMTEKGFRPEVILKNINTKLYSLLPTGMFMAACMVEINAVARSACVLNCGMPDIYLVDARARKITQRIGSTHVPLGIDQDKGSRLEFREFDIGHDDLFILHSDGLTDAVDKNGRMFDTRRLENIIESKKDGDIFESIVNEYNAFSEHIELSDDITLVAIPCGENLESALWSGQEHRLRTMYSDKGGWRLSMEISGASLKDIDPVPLVIDQYNSLDGQTVGAEALRDILTALYENALNHGVLEMSQLFASLEVEGEAYDTERNKRFDSIPYGFVRIEMEQILHGGEKSIFIRVEDSGRGFDHTDLFAGQSDRSLAAAAGKPGGLAQVREISTSMHFRGRGNRVEVIVGSRADRGGAS